MFDALLRIFALTRKELVAVLKDPRSRASLLIPPMLQCLIFGYAATYDLNDVPYAVLDHDRSAASHDLLARLDGSGVFRRVANLDRAADVKTVINERRALLVIQIDQDFERRLSLVFRLTCRWLLMAATPTPLARLWAMSAPSSKRSTPTGGQSMARPVHPSASPCGRGTIRISKPAGT